MFCSIQTWGWVMSQYQMYFPSEESNVRSNTWFRAVLFERFLAIVGQSILLSFITVLAEFHYERSWSIAENKVSDDGTKCAQARDIKTESTKAVTPGPKRSKRAGSRRILHIPTPDYSYIQPKTDSWRRESEICSDDEVSGAVTCDVVHC
jgi:hypothetical protein